MSGFYLMYRGWQDNPVFSKEVFSERTAWIWLIEEAAWKACRKRIGGVVADLGRGQLVGSVRHLAEAWGWSKSRVDRFLGRLADEGMIGTDAGHGVNIISISNYDKYQASQDDDRDSSGTAAGQQRDSSGTNKKEVKEVKEEEDSSLRSESTTPLGARHGRSSRGTRLPPDWQPTEAGFEFAEGLGLDPVAVLAEFRDYWVPLPGSRGCKLDWEGTWRNRCREIAGRKPRIAVAGRDRQAPAGFASALRGLRLAGEDG